MNKYPDPTTQVPCSPTVDEGVIKESIAKFQPTVERAINDFLERDTQLPLWEEPEACSDDVRRHIAGLKIPQVSIASGVPSLLLHNLGHYNEQLANRVELLFAPNLNLK